MRASPGAAFAWAVLGLYLLLWGAELVFPGTVASGLVLVLATAAGVLAVRPGWNIRPRGTTGYCLALFGLLLASAALAAGFLRLSGIRAPYDLAAPSLLAALPWIAAITGIEELLFRQVAFRWLERRQVREKRIVIATAVAFGFAHSGALLAAGADLRLFHLLQSLYMVWIGMLLGELRRATGSWAMSWLGHFGYNILVLALLL